MASLADLHRTVQATLASKRLGVPVFVRYQLTSRDKPVAALRRLQGIAEVVRAWLGQPVEQIYALGSTRSGQVTLTLECRAGATAVVSWASSRGAGSGVDLMVLGNHGAIYHDGGTSILWDEPIQGEPEAAPAGLRAAIERALQSEGPVRIEEARP